MVNMLIIYAQTAHQISEICLLKENLFILALCIVSVKNPDNR
jgi:hypothetical protein